jgi:hypothetical protein
VQAAPLRADNGKGEEMATINYGDKNHTVASLNVNSDTVIFGSGQQDMLSLNGDQNTVTFGDGNLVRHHRIRLFRSVST